MSYIFNPLQNEGFIPVAEQAVSSRGLGYEHPSSALPPIDPNKGDRWIEISEEGNWIQNWFWNGAYWLSQNDTNATNQDAYLTNNGQGATIPLIFTNNANIFITKFRFNGRMDGDVSPGGTTDSNANYWNFNYLLVAGGGSRPIPNSEILTTKLRSYSQFSNIFITSKPINSHIIVAPNGSDPDNGSFPRCFFAIAEKVGSPPLISNSQFIINYYLARP